MRYSGLASIVLTLLVGWASCSSGNGNTPTGSGGSSTNTGGDRGSGGSGGSTHGGSGGMAGNGSGGATAGSGGNATGGRSGEGGSGGASSDSGGSGGSSSTGGASGGASGYGGGTSQMGGGGATDAATSDGSGGGMRGDARGAGGEATASGGSTGASGGSTGAHDGGVADAGTGAAFSLTSTKLPDGGTFPTSATCEATTPSSQLPPLTWTGAPAGTKSFAMVFVDITLTGATPPSTNGFHSAMWNIPAGVSSLPEGLPAGSPPAGIAGLETVQQKKAPSGMAFLGPCPNFPSTTRTKTDTYQFRLYAVGLDSLPSNTSSMSIQQIYNYLEALPPLGVAILSGTSNAAATALK